jgi:Asp-tRNA(Asn)/Glu-tRNA(Gln) amidotransferase A subunit family amidase
MRPTVWLAGLLSLAVAGAQSRTFDVLTATVADIQAAVDAGALTYERLVGLYLKRIEAYDPTLGSCWTCCAVSTRTI